MSGICCTHDCMCRQVPESESSHVRRAVLCQHARWLCVVRPHVADSTLSSPSTVPPSQPTQVQWQAPNTPHLAFHCHPHRLFFFVTRTQDGASFVSSHALLTPMRRMHCICNPRSVLMGQVLGHVTCSHAVQTGVQDPPLRVLSHRPRCMPILTRCLVASAAPGFVGYNMPVHAGTTKERLHVPMYGRVDVCPVLLQLVGARNNDNGSIKC